MDSQDTWDQKQVLRDPEMLAHLERKLRGAGMPRRTFLAMASAVAGSAALAACGGTTSPTATTAATTVATKAPAAAAPTTAAAAPTTAAAAPTTAAAAPTTAAAATTAPTTGAASAAAATKAPIASSAASTAAPASTTAASSSVAGAPTGPESTKVFIDGVNINQEPVDNDFNRDLYCGGVSQHMSGLLSYSPDFDLVPDLAESFSNSGPVFTFKIRKGAVWSDGQPMTAKDFVFSTLRMIDPRTANGYGSFWDGVRHVGSC